MFEAKLAPNGDKPADIRRSRQLGLLGAVIAAAMNEMSVASSGSTELSLTDIDLSYALTPGAYIYLPFQAVKISFTVIGLMSGNLALRVSSDSFDASKSPFALQIPNRDIMY